MKQAIKVTITALVVFFCSFVCILSLGFFIAGTNDIRYVAEKMVDPIIRNVSVKELGKEYKGQTMENCSYYLLSITMDNQNNNYGKVAYDINIRYEQVDDLNYYYVEELEDEISFSNIDNNYYLPPGKELVIYEVICLEDGCPKLELVYKNYEMDTEQRVTIDF